MEADKKGHLFVLSGPSGAGKGAICAGLTVSERVALSVSVTTRAPREHEVNGKSYYFVDKEKCKEILEKDGLLEYAEVFGEYYGTPRAPVLEKLDQGIDVILEIEVDGATQVKERMPDAVLVFIMPPSFEELRRRIEKRGTESPESIEKRLARAESEVAQLGKYDYCVVNGKLKKAINDVFAIMYAVRWFSKYTQFSHMLMGLQNMMAVRRAVRLKLTDESVQKIIEGYRAGSKAN